MKLATQPRRRTVLRCTLAVLSLGLASALTVPTASLAEGTPNTAVSWGYNKDGQLGNGGTTNSDVPVPVAGLRDVAAISAGDSFSLALLNNGTVMAWGMNSS